MKKLLLLSLVLIAFVIPCITSCDKDDDEIKDVVVLNVYNWGEYISDGFEGAIDSNAEFEKYFNENLSKKYGFKVEVNYTTYATNEDMYSKLSSGSADGVYDVIIPSDYMLQRMADEGMLHSFNVAEEIPNYKYIADEFKGLYYDSDEQYSVPYTYGMVGVIYNSALMNPEDLDENGEIKDKSWALLWDKDYAGKILQFNNPRDAFATAMFYHGIDINTADRSEWIEALGYLKEQKYILQGYVNDEIFNKMTTGSAVMAPYFAGDFISMYDSLPEDDKFLKFYYPEEGTNVFVDAMCILKTSKMKDAAMEYINFMLSRDAAVANALYIGYASPNILVANGDEFDEEYFDEMGEDAIQILYNTNPSEINKKYPYEPYYHMFDDKTQEHVYSLWESLKTENAIELWVHVSSAVIVASLLAICITRVILKKRRSLFYRKRETIQK